MDHLRLEGAEVIGRIRTIASTIYDGGREILDRLWPELRAVRAAGMNPAACDAIEEYFLEIYGACKSALGAGFSMDMDGIEAHYKRLQEAVSVEEAAVALQALKEGEAHILATREHGYSS